VGCEVLQDVSMRPISDNWSPTAPGVTFLLRAQLEDETGEITGTLARAGRRQA
jgi:hypothetical protein